MRNLSKMRISDPDLGNFLTDDLKKLDRDQKYLLFQKLEVPIQFAVTKATGKFHFLPLEKDDFTSIAWMAFEDVIVKYQKTKTRKSFVSYVIDSVYWKCLDYAASFLNNHHKILNNWERGGLDVENKAWGNEDLAKQLTTKMVVEDYFQNLPESELVFQVFNDYLYQIPVAEICQKYGISRNSVKKILNKTIGDLTKLLA